MRVGPYRDWQFTELLDEYMELKFRSAGHQGRAYHELIAELKEEINRRCPNRD